MIYLFLQDWAYDTSYSVHRAKGYKDSCDGFPGFILDSVKFVIKFRQTVNFGVTESLGVVCVGIDTARNWVEGTNTGLGINAGEVTWNSDQHGTSTWATPGAVGTTDTTGHESNEITVTSTSHAKQGDSLVFFIDTILANTWQNTTGANEGVLLFIKNNWANKAGPYAYYSDFNNPGYADSIPYWTVYGHMGTGVTTKKIGAAKLGSSKW